MANIDRSSYYDAKIIFEKLLKDVHTRSVVIDFLSDIIAYTDTINPENWNLNLDLKGQFIRFNVGHEYCIEIRINTILILCDRVSLKSVAYSDFPILFRGHSKKTIIDSANIDEVPDCLAKTKNSIGCILKLSELENNLDFLKSSTFDFIKSAINTKQIPKMRAAHSKGVIDYLVKDFNKVLNNPIYSETTLPTYSSIVVDEVEMINKVSKLSVEKRRLILKQSSPKPKKIIVSQVVFIRNQYVIAEVLDRANGICERCKKEAPFYKDNDNRPYLEVHHIIPLSENGNDTVENTIALCPNCHRHAHYGKKSYLKF